ncbi:MAG: hypothetical protein WDW38_000144 [Sanguina aurantia]
MDSEQRDWLVKLTGLLTRMTAEIAIVSETGAALLPTPASIPAMQALHTSLLSTSSAFFCPHAIDAYGPMPRPFLPLVAAFTQLLTTLVPRMAALAPRMTRAVAARGVGVSDEEALFHQLWSFLAVGCRAFDDALETWPSGWNEDHKPLCTALFLAWHSLLGWLRPLVRSSTWPDVMCASYHQASDSQLALILAQPAKCFAGICCAGDHTLLYFIGSVLPSDFLPMLCSLTLELPLTDLASCPQLLRAVMAAISNLHLPGRCPKGLPQFLKNPAVATCWRTYRERR